MNEELAEPAASGATALLHITLNRQSTATRGAVDAMVVHYRTGERS